MTVLLRTVQGEEASKPQPADSSRPALSRMCPSNQQSAIRCPPASGSSLIDLTNIYLVSYPFRHSPRLDTSLGLELMKKGSHSSPIFPILDKASAPPNPTSAVTKYVQCCDRSCVCTKRPASLASPPAYRTPLTFISAVMKHYGSPIVFSVFDHIT
jgi:hypothetical protein